MPNCYISQFDNRISEQPTASMPFVQELVSFAVIASRTGNHQIIRAVRTASAQGYHMVNMIVFIYLYMAVVTLALLSLVLYFYILLGMGTYGLLLECAALTIGNSAHFWMQGIILLLPVFQFFTMQFSILSCPFSMPFFISFIPCLVLYQYLLSVTDIVTPYECVVTGDTSRSKPPSLIGRLAMEEFRGCKKHLLAMSAAFVAIWNIIYNNRVFSVFCIPALFTVGIKSARHGSVSGKELRDCRVPLLTIGAAFLGYNVTHGKGYSLTSRLGMFAASPRQHIFSHYTITPPVKQLQEVSW